MGSRDTICESDMSLLVRGGEWTVSKAVLLAGRALAGYLPGQVRVS